MLRRLRGRALSWSGKLVPRRRRRPAAPARLFAVRGTRPRRNLWHGCAQFFGPGPHRGASSFGGAEKLKSNLVSSALAKNSTSRTPSTALPARPGLPQRGDAAVDQRRADGTVFYWKKFMRGELEISCRELGPGAHLQARAIAIVPGRRRMDLDFALQFELGDAAQVLAQDFFLDLELMIVGGVLVVASAATGEMWARRLTRCGEGSTIVVA